MQLQGRSTDLVKHLDYINAFELKLQLWGNSISVNNFAHFPTLNTHTPSSSTQKLIGQHMRMFKARLKNYFASTLQNYRSLISNVLDYDVEKIDIEYQEEFLELTTDTNLKEVFIKEETNTFWTTAYNGYPNISGIALRFILPFSSTYLCECSFSTLLFIKSKHRSRVDPLPQMRLALSNLEPRIDMLSRP